MNFHHAFRHRGFEMHVNVRPDDDPDLSHYEDEIPADLQVDVVRVSAWARGVELGNDALGGVEYRASNGEGYTDHIMNVIENHGMHDAAIEDALKTLEALKEIVAKPAVSEYRAAALAVLKKENAIPETWEVEDGEDGAWVSVKLWVSDRQVFEWRSK